MTATDHAELDRLLAMLEADSWPTEIAAARTFYDRWGTPVAPDVEVVEAELGGLPAWRMTPPDADRGRVGMWLHGGGYTFGSQVSHGATVAEVARLVGAAFWHPQYRRAPEHRHPAALDDALAAYTALLEQGFAAADIVLAGDSAGGGLAIACVAAARDRGLPVPGALATVSAWTDLTLSGDSFTARDAIDPLMSATVVRQVAQAYLGDADRATPTASPLHADLHGFPPTLLQVGEREMVHDDSTRLADRLAAAGAAVTLEVWPGMVHVWHLHHTRLAKARAALDRLGAFLRDPRGGTP